MADRRIVKFLRRLAAAALPAAVMLLPVAATMVLAKATAEMASDHSHVFGNPDWSTFGDALPVAALFLAALYFRSRWCAALAAAAAWSNLLARIAALVLYREALMGFDYWDLRMLWVHADLGAIGALLGKDRLLLSIPAALLTAAAVAGAFWLAGCCSRRFGRAPRRAPEAPLAV